jgi:hypothetical protein
MRSVRLCVAAATYISWLFIWEMAIKLLGLGCAGYWSDGWNKLDGSIVTMSIVEMVRQRRGSKRTTPGHTSPLTSLAPRSIA